NASGGVPVVVGGASDGVYTGATWILEGTAALGASTSGPAAPEVGQPVAINLTATANLPWAGDRSFLRLDVDGPGDLEASDLWGNATLRFTGPGTWSVAATVLDRYDESWFGGYTFDVVRPVVG